MILINGPDPGHKQEQPINSRHHNIVDRSSGGLQDKLAQVEEHHPGCKKICAVKQVQTFVLHILEHRFPMLDEHAQREVQDNQQCPNDGKK